jgi:hypothetical protein
VLTDKNGRRMTPAGHNIGLLPGGPSYTAAQVEKEGPSIWSYEDGRAYGTLAYLAGVQTNENGLVNVRFGFQSGSNDNVCPSTCLWSSLGFAD